jgi:hypothetical protein
MTPFFALPALVLVLVLVPACGGGGDDDSGDDDDPIESDAGPRADAAPGSPDAGPTSLASIDLTFSGGCAPSFAGRDVVVVSNNESIAISTVDQPFLSIQFDIQSTTSGTIQLSRQQRIDTGDVVNLTVVNDTWTNMTGDTVDPIDGALIVTGYQEQAGIIDITFDDAVLQAVQSQTLCTINGRVQTFGTSF